MKTGLSPSMINDIEMIIKNLFFFEFCVFLDLSKIIEGNI